MEESFETCMGTQTKYQKFVRLNPAVFLYSAYNWRRTIDV